MLIIFSIVPMLGIVIAFQNYQPARGFINSQFIGLRNFQLLLAYPDVRNIFVNTIVISVSKMILGIVVPVTFAVMLNELKFMAYKRFVQTIVYIPHFLSWVILAVMFHNIFSYTGMANKIVELFGGEPILFMVSNTWFRPIIIATDIWKSFGYGAIIYLAAISHVDPNIYEAAAIDGANRMRIIWHIILPTISTTIVLMATLSLGSVLNAGFDQIYNMYTPLVYKTGDIIDTYVYRMGLQRLQFSFATAVGLLKSVVSLILVVTSYKLADIFTGYTLF
ncbi:MAG: ABC transporter permease subunit [Oscillospiraceae bacterium]|nr:ABC transporter permease subunit [Oscillospiraceae bacterium]